MVSLCSVVSRFSMPIKVSSPTIVVVKSTLIPRLQPLNVAVSPIVIPVSSAKSP